MPIFKLYILLKNKIWQKKKKILSDYLIFVSVIIIELVLSGFSWIGLRNHQHLVPCVIYYGQTP